MGIWGSPGLYPRPDLGFGSKKYISVFLNDLNAFFMVYIDRYEYYLSNGTKNLKIASSYGVGGPIYWILAPAVNINQFCLEITATEW